LDSGKQDLAEFIKPIQSQIWGEILFAKCIGCHSVGYPASNFIEPELANIVGRKIASKNNSDYSPVFYGMASDVWI
jgi:cytochrome c2